MATLNTLRTKFGIVLSVVIAFALLAFIFSLKSEMGFSGNDPIVLTINDQDISYSEYSSEYETLQEMNGMDGSTTQQVDALSSAVLQSFVTRQVIDPSLKALGIVVSESERQSIIRGEIATQAFYGAFADPSTGVYDNSAVAMFLLQSTGNTRAEAVWNFINEQARIEREGSKFISLVSAGSYVNNLEVDRAVSQNKSQVSGRWASKRYSAVADSLVAVNRAEIKKYYNENQARFKKTPSRTLTYVTFDIVATADDKSEIESSAREAGAALAATDDMRAFIRDNRYGSISTVYSTSAQLLPEEAEAFKAGKTYGPILKRNTWRMSRPFETRMAPDSLGIRIVALPYTSSTLADSLFAAVKGGADFAEVAMQNSLHTQSAQAGGDVGVLPFSALALEMAEALVDAKEGAVFKVEVGDMIQILQSYNVGRKTTQYRVASVEYPVAASQSTINKAHSDAALFVADAKGSKSVFEDAAAKHSVSAMDIDLSRGDREIMGIASSREIARWAYGAKEGDLSPIFKADNSYIVATLTAIDNSEYTTLADATPTIKSELLKDKKFELIKSEIEGESFDEAAKSLSNTASRTFSDVTYSTNFISGMGVEPTVIGAISSSTLEAGKLSEPVKGSNGLYIFEITSRADVADPLSNEAERVRLQSAAESTAQRTVYQTIQQMAEVDDLRGMYF